MVSKKETSDNSVILCMTSKAAYASPRLVVYGQVRALTQGGSKGGCEATANSTDKMSSNQCGSDRGIKENIVAVGMHPSGIGLYLFDYRPEFRAQWGHGRQFGVMADEVETVMPEAVCQHPDGYRMVNYEMLCIERTIH